MFLLAGPLRKAFLGYVYCNTRWGSESRVRGSNSTRPLISGGGYTAKFVSVARRSFRVIGCGRCSPRAMEADEVAPPSADADPPCADATDSELHVSWSATLEQRGKATVQLASIFAADTAARKISFTTAFKETQDALNRQAPRPPGEALPSMPSIRRGVQRIRPRELNSYANWHLPIRHRTPRPPTPLALFTGEATSSTAHRSLERRPPHRLPGVASSPSLHVERLRPAEQRATAKAISLQSRAARPDGQAADSASLAHAVGASDGFMATTMLPAEGHAGALLPGGETPTHAPPLFDGSTPQAPPPALVLTTSLSALSFRTATGKPTYMPAQPLLTPVLTMPIPSRHALSPYTIIKRSPPGSPAAQPARHRSRREAVVYDLG